MDTVKNPIVLGWQYILSLFESIDLQSIDQKSLTSLEKIEPGDVVVMKEIPIIAKKIILTIELLKAEAINLLPVDLQQVEELSRDQLPAEIKGKICFLNDAIGLLSDFFWNEFKSLDLSLAIKENFALVTRESISKKLAREKEQQLTELGSPFLKMLEIIKGIDLANPDLSRFEPSHEINEGETVLGTASDQAKKLWLAYKTMDELHDEAAKALRIVSLETDTLLAQEVEKSHHLLCENRELLKKLFWLELELPLNGNAEKFPNTGLRKNWQIVGHNETEKQHVGVHIITIGI